jgi:glycosyltransferase involved in cell wall biosynthesis
MIVKDESRVIQRCLHSVKDLISYWVICDTGSTDGTQDLIRETLGGVPGELHERPWIDFGHNRTESLRLARGKGSYLLLLDADWTFSAAPGALDGLSADAYLVRQVLPQGNGLEFHNRNLVRGDREWWYVGVTHEYIDTKGKVKERRLDGAMINNWGDGGVGRAKRWEQDAALLQHGIRKEPRNARYVFYLAQTYRDLGDTRRAIELYRKRATMGGWAEEVFYSLYQVGILLEKLGEWDAAVPALLKAWKFRPTRIEPLHALAVGYRLREDYAQAHRYAVRALKQREPTDILYVESWIYRWGVLFEYSISAYWTGGLAEALQACERLLQRSDLPPEYRANTEQNRQFCMQALHGDRSPTSSPGFAMRDGKVVVTLPRQAR